MITNFNTYINESLQNKEYKDCIDFLNTIFDEYSKKDNYLKNLSFEIIRNDYVYFEIDILWNFSNFTHIIYKIYKQGFNLIIKDLIKNYGGISYNKFSNFKYIIDNICNENIFDYMDYDSYITMNYALNNKILILDYDKFLKCFEQAIDETTNNKIKLDIYKNINNFDTILKYLSSDEINEIKNRLRKKYKYLEEANNFDLI